MNGAEMYFSSNLINSGKEYLSDGAKQTFEGLESEQQQKKQLSGAQIEVVRDMLTECFTQIVKEDVQKAAQYLGSLISERELKRLNGEMAQRLSPGQTSPQSEAENPSYQKRISLLRSSLEEVSGDNVL